MMIGCAAADMPLHLHGWDFRQLQGHRLPRETAPALHQRV